MTCARAARCAAGSLRSGEGLEVTAASQRDAGVLCPLNFVHAVLGDQPHCLIRAAVVDMNFCRAR